MKQDYILTKELKEYDNLRGTILMENNGVVLVQRKDLFTVWMPHDGFIITHTRIRDNAESIFQKYSKIGGRNE